MHSLKTTESWDVIIIGGGATGLGVAVDSASRGYKTVLLEQVDFAKGTSSRSTKLVHGGVRYLAQGNIDLVREALYERGLMRKNADHLVSDQPFIIPTYSFWGTWFYTIGLKIYDLLSGKLSFGKSTRISKKATEERLPTLKSDTLRKGVLYHDGQFDDARLAINLAQTAIEQGATVLNHFQVTQLLKNSAGKISGVEAQDCETNTVYTLKSKVVINATGVFSDAILQMDNAEAKPSIRPSQGIHLVLDQSFLPSRDAIMIPKTSDGRVLFLVPWHNRVVVGTTDTLLDSHSLEPKALESEIAFILQTANNYLSKPVTKNDVLSIYAGLRPLAAPKDASEKTKEISRSHKVIVSESELVTITGGKWTTYRRMAQDTLNKVITLGKLPPAKCRTKQLKIHGAGLVLDETDHFYVYGSDYKAIAQLIEAEPELGEKLHPDLEFTKAEVLWAIRNEMARTVDDILSRRVRLLFLDARAAIDSAPIVAAMLAKELGKDKNWQDQQVTTFLELAKSYVL
ncbi:glycerol-3-phosphate dehydrogenase/oxidase [Gaetbulibacter sp. M240]|uniref:glycerol-3-phosphate dehydrogenase/oxidase n=1 Tax=Gaetbulibacter sp. M240 TaxID=3126511 RepID=UPI00374E981F